MAGRQPERACCEHGAAGNAWRMRLLIHSTPRFGAARSYLSVVSHKTVFSHMFLALSMSTKRPIDASRLDAMLHSVPRSLVTSGPIGDVQLRPAHAAIEALSGGLRSGAWISWWAKYLASARRGNVRNVSALTAWARACICSRALYRG
jgi:hypothetical protein